MHSHSSRRVALAALALASLTGTILGAIPGYAGGSPSPSASAHNESIPPDPEVEVIADLGAESVRFCIALEQ